MITNILNAPTELAPPIPHFDQYHPNLLGVLSRLMPLKNSLKSKMIGQEITLTPRNYENAHLNMEKVLQIPHSGKRLHPTVCMNINITEHC